MRIEIDEYNGYATARCPCGWWQTYCGDAAARRAHSGLRQHSRMKHLPEVLRERSATSPLRHGAS